MKWYCERRTSKNIAGTKILLSVLSIVLLVISFGFAGNPESTLDLYQMSNPYLRPKNGPPLTNVVHKVNLPWLYTWLKNPQGHDPTAKMPNLKLEEPEIQAIINYLKSIADSTFPEVKWDAYLLKDEEEWTDDDWVQLDLAIARGEKIWRRSRCTICHIVEGRGGFVNVRVGKSLDKIAGKVKRDWLYRWLKNPQAYFPQTLMPRFRLSDDEIKDLVVYIMYADPFQPFEEEGENIIVISPSSNTEQIALGKRTIELSRCVLCHEIKGIREIMPVTQQGVRPSEDFFDLLNEVKCLTCHNIAGQGGDYAPELTFEGSKLKFEWITNFLTTPDIIRPLSQQMPRFNLNSEEAEVAARFIKKNLLRLDLKPGLSISQNPTRDQINKGEKIYQSKGCHACHSINGKGGAVGPELTFVGDRLEPDYIFFHLKDPNRAVPFSPEPNYGLSDEEALALTYFLMSRKLK